MKKFLLLTWAVIAVFSLNSCSKDDDGKKDDPNDPQPQEMRYVKSVRCSNGDTYSYEYDDQHRRTKCINYFTNEMITCTYTYSTNDVTVAVKNEVIGHEEYNHNSTTVLQLNAKGYVISASEVGGENENSEFIYDSDGYLISSPMNGGYTYSWINGNLMTSKGDETLNFGYNTNTIKPISVDLLGILAGGYMGEEWWIYDPFIEKHNANLVTTIKGSINANLVYTFDDEGYITKITNSQPTYEGESLSYEIMYY